MKRRSKILIVITFLLIAIGGYAVYYVNDYYRAEPFVLSDKVGLIDETDLTLFADGDNALVGFVLYPGAKVDPYAYIPLMEPLAQAGYTVVIAKMPFNLAVLDSNRMDSIKTEHSEVKTWYLIGHSLGGAMAGSYVAKHPTEIAGLFLLGGYTTSDIHDYKGIVATFTGSDDMVMSREKFESNRTNLPQSLCEITIEGGNHGQFGNYGHQAGDGNASISAKQQQNIVTDTMLSLIKGENCQGGHQ
ncbi:alpha/beta fold hydrolase [Erysipelothrix sp. HDW6C]|uniref:alpha/beta fold hydrolase n=1 Tax=Erysipelothrix sp. HDW6C TaxID=2714930 RepID=UPI00140BD94E|nr:alpha/beta fold hydrolase [Erysipelothrix sp. HDW6C]QIK70549.1 alpha/beta fold hydrolase [Erysipelothrix sp. HDW6C]